MTGHIRQRSDGSWSLQWYIGRVDGKPRYGSATVKARSKQAARRELERIMHESRGQQKLPEVSTADFMQHWLDTTRASLGAKTHERYAQMVRLHVVPRLGSIPLASITQSDIQSFLAWLQSDGRVRGGGLAAMTVLHYHRLLHKALRDAVRWGKLGVNPADDVACPRVERQQVQVYTPAQVGNLLSAVAGTTLYLPVLLAVSTGMRRGEVLALRWSDVDWSAGVAQVCRSLSETAAGLAFKEPKTGRGRLVSVPAGICRLLWADGGPTDGLICAGAEGEPIRPDSLSAAFRYACDRAGIPRLPFHSLRHAYATWCLVAGVHPRIVQEQLGHCAVGVTLDIYSHVVPGLQSAAAKAVDVIMAGIMTREG